MADAEGEIYGSGEGALSLDEGIAKVAGSALILSVYFFADRICECTGAI